MSFARPLVRTLGLVTFAAVSLLSSQQAWSAVVYSTKSSFLAAVGTGAYTETFTTAGRNDAQTFDFDNGNYSFQATSVNLYGLTTSGTTLGNAYPNKTLTLNFSRNVEAVGGNFFNVDPLLGTFIALSMTITLADGTTTTFTPTSADDYIGFTSTIGIGSLTISAPGARGMSTLDNLTVGTFVTPAPVQESAVPEPGSLALAGAGLIGLAVAPRRRKRVDVTA